MKEKLRENSCIAQLHMYTVRQSVLYCTSYSNDWISYGKYTTCKIHTKLHTGPEWHILTSEDIDDVISRFFMAVCVWLLVFYIIILLYIITNNITRKLENMNFIFLWQGQYLTRSLPSLVKYCSCHSNIKFIYFRHRVISFMYL